MNCPQCNSEMWDNTVNKKNPKGPDYKCKDKACAHPIWLDKKGAKAAPAKNGNAQGGGAKWTWPQLSALYRNSLLVARKHVVGALPNAAPADVIAATATVFIAASRDGVKEPVKEMPATTQPLHERPAALDDDDESSDLPF